MQVDDGKRLLRASTVTSEWEGPWTLDPGSHKGPGQRDGNVGTSVPDIKDISVGTDVPR